MSFYHHDVHTIKHSRITDSLANHILRHDMTFPQDAKINALLASGLSSPAAVTLFSNGKLDALALGQRDPWLLTANDEDVALTGSELIVDSILDVHNVEATVVALTMRDDTHTTLVTTTSHHSDDTGIELNEVGDLASRQVDLDRVVDLDLWVWVADRSCIMRHKEGDAALAQLDTADLAQLVLGFLAGDSVYGEATLGIVDEAEVLAGLLDADDILEASWVRWVGADLAVNLDEALHDDLLDLAAIEGVLQSVSDEDDERHAVAKLVGTWRGLWRIGTGQFVQQPVRWR